ncbi:MAG: capsule assembly Wzi family protein, partial [Paludibacter sp.]|nr:capsule assembly Wzi family protein [Paludibacter sp.]
MIIKLLSKIKILIGILFLSTMVGAQNDTIKYGVTLSGLTSSGQYAPFWLQSLAYGKVFHTPNTMYTSVMIFKDYGNKRQIFDYAFKADFLARTDMDIIGIYVPGKREYYFHELYAKARILGLNLMVGVHEEIIGNQDSTLSSGGFIFSKNARPIPKATAGFPEFIAIPSTGELIWIKGALSHGMFLDNAFAKDVLLHHKYLYLRFVLSDFPVWFEGGVDHFAQWGGVLPKFGKVNTNLINYIRVFFGKQGGSDATLSDQVNSFGNHIISQSVKGGANLGDFKISAYWQNLSEDGPLKIFWGAMNKEDGLFGFSVKNKKFPVIQGFLYEYLTTTDQSGPYHDKDGMIYGGNDG